MLQQYNKAYLGGLGPILLTLLLKLDSKILAPIDWSMGDGFWTAVVAFVIAVLVAKVPNQMTSDQKAEVVAAAADNPTVQAKAAAIQQSNTGGS